MQKKMFLFLCFFISWHMRKSTAFMHFFDVKYKVKSVRHAPAQVCLFGSQGEGWKNWEKSQLFLAQHCNWSTEQTPSDTQNKMNITIWLMAQIRAHESTKEDELCVWWYVKIKHCLTVPSHQVRVQVCRATAVLNCCSTELGKRTLC